MLTITNTISFEDLTFNNNTNNNCNNRINNINNNINNNKPTPPSVYPIDFLLTTLNLTIKDTLFFDIETTGLSAKNAHCYLIGVVYLDKSLNTWKYIQWFADSNDAEADIICEFFSFISDYNNLIHFNGNTFDIPFLLERCHKLQLNYSFNDINSFDVYKELQPLKKLLSLANYKQKSIENFLNINRTDIYSGKELINIYKKYLDTKENNLLEVLLLHNRDDICCLPLILPVLLYKELKNDSLIFKNVSCNVNSYTDFEQNQQQECIIKAELPFSVPSEIICNYDDYTIKINSLSLSIRIPIICDTLKYFFSNYKDYYYLENEDYAIHKSVGIYVDKNQVKQATAATCYAKKTGLFLSQFNSIIKPEFLYKYKDKKSFFELNEAFLADTEKQSAYIHHILKCIFK